MAIVHACISATSVAMPPSQLTERVVMWGIYHYLRGRLLAKTVPITRYFLFHKHRSDHHKHGHIIINKDHITINMNNAIVNIESLLQSVIKTF